MNESGLISGRWLPTVFVVAVISVGCAESVRDDSRAVADRSDDESPQSQVDLQIVDRNEYDALIGEHRGKVVLVDFWATWCTPCVQQLPHTIELADRLRERGLAVMTVSFDDPSEAERVAKFLSERGAGEVSHLMSQFGAGPESMIAFEIAGGALPHYKLYDRTGRLRRTFGGDPLAENPFTPQEIDAVVEQLLAE